MKSLYTLEDRFLCLSSNVISQSVACLFILLILSLAEQKILILVKSSLSIIFLVDCCDFGVSAEEASLYPRSSMFSPVFSSRNFSFVFYI